MTACLEIEKFGIFKYNIKSAQLKKTTVPLQLTFQKLCQIRSNVCKLRAICLFKERS